MNIDVSTIDQIATICESTAIDAEHQLFLKKLANVFPDLTFSLVLTRTGWHRTGGVIDVEGNRIAINLRTWLEEEQVGDIEDLVIKYADSGYIATGLSGKTHYFVAQTGESAKDFIQLEVEELQEVKGHILFENENLFDDIEDIINPVDVEYLEHEPVASPYYVFRRVTAINEFVQSMADSLQVKGNKYRSIQRFMYDWDRSSAHEIGPFCHHWVLSLQENTDAWGERILQAKPVNTFVEDLPLMKLNGIHRGSELARLIHGFDHDIGYPMAWYFFMLSHKEVPHQLAEAIHKDLMGAYDYLPAKDLKVLKEWSKQPYGI